MTPEEVGRSYDQIADRWRADRFPRENGIPQHKRALAFVDERPGRALDIGCGASGRFIELLIDYGFEVEGVDISARMLELARERHPQVTFHQADICQWELPRKYDFISAWDSIWHVPLEAHERVLHKVLTGLSPGGVCIFTTGGIDQPDETLDSEMGPQMYHSAPGIPNILRTLDEAGCTCRHLEYDQYPELHVYIVAQRTN